MAYAAFHIWLDGGGRHKRISGIVASSLIYQNRFFAGALNLVGRVILRLGGWTIVGEMPPNPKFVAIAGPHTSNWDFPIFMAFVGVMRLEVRFLGKHTLFKGPLGWLFYWLGGIPVTRKVGEGKDVVAAAVQVFNENDRLILGLAPEGTRSKVNRWKNGFYRIAEGAGVPILPVYLDNSKREIGIGALFHPTGDIKAEVAAIQAFYAGKVGINPENQ